MGLDIYSNIIVGIKLKDVKDLVKNSLKRVLKKHVGSNWKKDGYEECWNEDWSQLIEEYLCDYTTKGGSSLITSGEGDDTPYVGIQLGGGWWETYELKISQLERAKKKFKKEFGVEAKIYIIPGMSV